MNDVINSIKTINCLLGGLDRAINKHGTTLDFYFSPKRNKNTAYPFIKRVLKPYPVERQPKILNTDKHSSYGYAITRLMKERKRYGMLQSSGKSNT
ncbi:transposase [Yersinia enterocolitica subsp. enterocolitica WA-314]|nr:DDE domain protein [Yersinia enterocolitica]AJJ21487.1 DDE domain protein [Yersinia enterocolitica]EKA25139.1 transposase [Yersinia enterocolitica subsp. enterocolitica WA-314]KGA79855.1 DDE domain protein [Yersinia enterocolitica]